MTVTDDSEVVPQTRRDLNSNRGVARNVRRVMVDNKTSLFLSIKRRLLIVRGLIQPTVGVTTLERVPPEVHLQITLHTTGSFLLLEQVPF